MDLFSRFVGIWIVCVIYLAVSVEGANYDEVCTVDGDCTETNAQKCDTGTKKCICSANFFRKTTANECAAQIPLNTNCDTAQTASDQCSKANSECKNDSGTDKCLCKPTHYETGSACVLKNLLNAACTNGHPAAQCLDTLAECRDESGFKCLCKTSNFESNDGPCSPQVGLDGICKVTESAKGQCSVADTECRNHGSESKCLCKATHYSDGSACQIRIVPGATCAAHQCVTHASCNTTSPTKCQCNVGYTAAPTVKPTMCSGVAKVTTLLYMLAVPIFVSMMFLLR